MAISAGTLTKRLTLQRAITVKNELGEEVETWIDVETVSAAKLNLPGEERLRAAEVAGAKPLRFQIRWAPEWADLDNTWRLIYPPTPTGRTFNIQDVSEMDDLTGDRPEGFEIRATARAESV
jgi:SPP1 family predicted phage head-tail adaptor